MALGAKAEAREQGGFAEYVSVPEGLLAPKPKNLSYAQAATVPMAAVTATWPMRLNQPVAQPQPGLPSFDAQ